MVWYIVQYIKKLYGTISLLRYGVECCCIVLHSVSFFAKITVLLQLVLWLNMLFLLINDYCQVTKMAWTIISSPNIYLPITKD